MGYQAIEDYALIGNMRTAALVGKNGAIDWMCLEKFDAPSVFARILDDERGGTFHVMPMSEKITQKQFYWPDTNVLISRFLCEEGVAEIVDYMPVGVSDELMQERWLIRRIRMVNGALPLRVLCHPAFNYARDTHEIAITANGAVFQTEDRVMGLSSPVVLTKYEAGVMAELNLTEGETVVFSLQLLDASDGDCSPALTTEEEHVLFEKTVTYWHDWLSHCTYVGRWREMVYRSALTLKLLTYEPTGAIVAAPTCSLPEFIGGGRNWDYRYTWLRDAAFTVYGFLRIGFTEEARAFTRWTEARMRELELDGSLQIMYSIEGGHEIEEVELAHLSGYRGSQPVRIGNAAYKQVQLDIYGELMDSFYLYNKYAEPVSYELWTYIRQMLDWVCENWQRTDKGIWEIRGADRAFVYSKVMLWVALDRGVRLADKRSLPAPVEKWREIRDHIYEEIMVRGWNEDIETFTQYYDGESLDASNLIMPLVFFMSPRDPRMMKTIESMNQPPDKGGLVSGGLVYRYNVEHSIDGLQGGEGTFNMCTFWLVEALTRAGRLEEARELFEQMLTFANHVGLYAEETGFRGEALGNFPQALTHLSLISAAYNLNRILA